MEKFNVAIYMYEETNNRNIIDIQKEKILEYLKDKPELNIVKEYFDLGCNETNRKGWQNLLKDINNRVINVVITTNSKCIANNNMEVCYYVTNEFPKKHIRYISVEEQIDTIDIIKVVQKYFFLDFD